MPQTARLHLRKGVRHRILEDHPWVFASEVGRVEGPAEDGGTIALLSPKGEFLGSAIYNSRSQIVARRYARGDVPLDEVLLSARLDAALAHRAAVVPGRDALRLVWSESDQLPGLIVDRYADVLVLQTLTCAMAHRQKIIAELLLKKTGCNVILARNDAPVRQLEGLPLERTVLHGEYHPPTRTSIAGISYALDLWTGQKTGFYLDQTGNYAAIAALAPGRRLLDCFTNQGAFALSAMRAGATSCEAIDQSAEALALAGSTAEAEGLAVTWRQGDVFELLRRYDPARDGFDLIVLDPPSFTRNRGNRDSALRGYHDLHVQALRILSPGGLLATFSCSHHVTARDWEDLLREAAVDARVTLRLRARLGQSPDHPVLVNVPETEYLRGYVVEKVRPG